MKTRFFSGLLLLVLVLTAPFYYVYFDYFRLAREVARIEKIDAALALAPNYRESIKQCN